MPEAAEKLQVRGFWKGGAEGTAQRRGRQVQTGECRERGTPNSFIVIHLLYNYFIFDCLKSI